MKNSFFESGFFLPKLRINFVCKFFTNDLHITTVCLLGRWHIWFKHLMCDDFIFCFYCAENCYTVCFSVIKLNKIYIVIFYISKVVGKVTARHMQRQSMALPMRRLTSRTSTLYTFTVPIPGVSWKLFYVWAKYFVEYPRTKFSI